jgi:ferrous iron transport protein A
VFQLQVIRSRRAAIADSAAPVVDLASGVRGLRGVVVQVGVGLAADDGELERRLLEIGFVEGARVEILHEGAIGRDPIAVKLDDMRVALRRREAAAILVRLGEAANDVLAPRLEAAE